jgi:hypothetical protein
MHVDGKCFCGAVAYEAEIDPEQVIICHCTDCQNHSGSAFRVAAAVSGDSFKLLSGELKSYDKVADSGTLRSRAFCPECGTNIYARTVGEGTGFFGLRVGTITQRQALTPKVRVWTRSALPWSQDLGDLPAFPQQPDLDALHELLES